MLKSKTFSSLFLLFSISIPFNAGASAFSSISAFFTPEAEASAIENAVNSQNIPLLQAAIHSDPNPNKGNRALSIVDDSAIETSVGPSGTFHEIEMKSQSDKISVYTVRSGDTLSSIASMFGVSVNTIVWANNLKNSKDIHKDDQLVILPISGIKHVVAKGETIKSIVSKYKADLDEVLSFNDLSIESKIAIGDEILIPDGEISAPQSTTPTKPVTPSKNISGYFMRPVVGGVRTQGLHGGCRCGVDIASKVGTPIYAAASGKVILSKEGGWNGGYGNYIVISHSNGTQTLYAHLQTTLVSVGNYVDKGEKIGLMGSTGNSTGTHLHVEVRGASNPF